MAARFWTHGFNFYSPCTTIAYHRWQRGYRPSFWDRDSKRRTLREERRDAHRRQDVLRSLERVESVLNGSSRGEGWGLGTARTLKDYEMWSNVSIADRKVGERARTGVPPS